MQRAREGNKRPLGAGSFLGPWLSWLPSLKRGGGRISAAKNKTKRWATQCYCTLNWSSKKVSATQGIVAAGCTVAATYYPQLLTKGESARKARPFIAAPVSASGDFYLWLRYPSDQFKIDGGH